MTLRLSPSARNPLVRRVLRHRNITTLFRAPMMPAEPPGQPAREPSEARDAFITVPARPVTARRDVMQAADVGEPTTPYRPPTERQPPAERHEEAPHPRPTAVRPAATRARSTGPAAARLSESPPERPPGAQSEPDTTITDDVWQRLTNIFRRHQEKDRDEGDITSETEPEAASPAASAHTQSATAPRPGDTAETESSEASGEDNRLPPAPGSSLEEAGDPEATSDEADVSTAGAEAPPPSPPPGAQETVGGAIEAATRPTTSAEIRRTPTPEVGPAQEKLVSPAQDRTPPASSSGTPRAQAAEPQTASRPDRERQAAAKTEEPGDELGPQRRARDSELAAPPAQRRGLLSAEATVVSESMSDQPAHRDPPPPQRSEGTAKGKPILREPATPPYEPPSPHGSQGARGIRQVEGPARAEREPAPQRPPLEEVWHVEHAGGRAGRTEPPSHAVGENATARRRTDVRRPAAPPPPQVQRHVSRPTRSSIEVIAPSRPRPVAAAAPRREPDQVVEDEEVRPQAPPSDADLVDTEIGPLPQDLWELIDEPAPQQERIGRPPMSQDRTEDRPEPRSPASPQPPAPRQPVAAPQSAAPRSASAPAAPAPTGLIQRAAAPALESAGEDAAAELDIGAGSEERAELAGEDAGLDVEELARRVYGEVKRRLAVEWERLRPHT